jgi:D-tyrosyl-tRNA(Tyr) deacylase
MRAVIQRVTEASVAVDDQIVGEIGLGLLVLLGVGAGDGPTEALLLAEKIANMRIFRDDAGRFNRSALDVSQFTLYADTRRGRRPSFSDAAPPEVAAPLVDTFAAALRERGMAVSTGVFGAHMRVALLNDGPVTILLDSDTFREPRNARS